jgi:hypothetical protein
MVQVRTTKPLSIWTGLRIDMFTLTFGDGSKMRLMVGGAPDWLSALVFATRALNGYEYTVAYGDQAPRTTTIGVLWSPDQPDQEEQQ